MAEPQTGEFSAIKFGRFVLDPDSRKLLKSGRELRIQAQPLSLLCILAGRAGELVLREELHALLWPGVAFLDFDAAINSTVRKLRQSLGDDAISPSFIRTVPKKGYIFIAPVQPTVVGLAAPRSETKPLSIAIVPRPEIRSALLIPRESDPAPEEIGSPETPPTPAAAAPATARHAKLVLIVMAAALGTIAVAVALFVRPAAAVNLDGVKYTANSAENSLIDCAISPDGKYLAYVDQHHVSVMSVSDRAVSVLTNLASVRASHLSWFPDSTNLLVGGSERSGVSQGLWRASIVGNYPPLPLFAGIEDGRVSPDGRYYALIGPDKREVRLAPADGSQTRTLAHAHEIHQLRWSPDSTRLYFTDRNELLYNRIESVPISGEKTEILKQMSGLLSIVLLPRNRLLYTGNDGRDTGTDIFQMETNATTGMAAGAPALLQSIHGVLLLDLSATNDGSRIAYLEGEEEATTWTGELRDGNMRLENPRRLAFKDGDSYPHGWTSDSRSVLFESLSGLDKWNIFGQEPGAPEAQALLHNLPPAIRPTAAPGGKWLLYQPFQQRERIMRIGAQGGTPAQIGSMADGIFHCPFTPGRPCVIGEQSGNRTTFSYLDPDRGRTGKWRDYSPAAPILDWDLSPDGRTVAVLNRGGDGNQIVLLKANEPPRQISVPNVRNLQSVNWWANGEGFFCSSANRDAVSLLSISLDLKVSVLETDVGAIPSWAVPSPDGHAIAYVFHIKHYNAWIASQHR